MTFQSSHEIRKAKLLAAMLPKEKSISIPVNEKTPCGNLQSVEMLKLKLYHKYKVNA